MEKNQKAFLDANRKITEQMSLISSTIDHDKVVDDHLSSIDANLTKHLQHITDSISSIAELRDQKLDKTVYDQIQPIIKNTLKTLQLRCDQNENNHTALENYIDKYYPFRMQKLITENIINFTKTKQNRAKEIENAIFKKLHAIVTNDDGIPHLCKEDYYGVTDKADIKYSPNKEIKIKSNNTEVVASKPAEPVSPTPVKDIVIGKLPHEYKDTITNENIKAEIDLHEAKEETIHKNIENKFQIVLKKCLFN